MAYLLYFAHFFDTMNPDLIGVFATQEDLSQARITIILPTSWKGQLISAHVPYGSFVSNGFFKHPLTDLNNKAEKK